MFKYTVHTQNKYAFKDVCFTKIKIKKKIIE